MLLRMRAAIARRFADCGLELHPQKTKIVYCKDDDRRGTYREQKFDFLGYTFRPRRSKNRYGKYFVNFTPGTLDDSPGHLGTIEGHQHPEVDG